MEFVCWCLGGIGVSVHGRDCGGAGLRMGAELKGTAERVKEAPNKLRAYPCLLGGVVSYLRLLEGRGSASPPGESLSFALCLCSKGDSVGTTARP